MELPDITAIIPKEVREFIPKLFGPAFEELGLMLQDRVKLWRLKGLITIGQKAKKLIEDAGMDPKPIPPKTLLPILEAGSLEEDESMQDQWAALLANAADPNSRVAVLPSFPDILRQLSPKEAAILHELFSLSLSRPTQTTDPRRKNYTAMGLLKERCQLSPHEIEIFIENLSRLGLCSHGTHFSTTSSSGTTETGGLSLTLLGYEFVLACRPPKRR